jgi:hypothetical protein
MSIEKEFDSEAYASDIRELIVLSNRISRMIENENNKDLIIKMLHLELQSMIGLFDAILDCGYHPKNEQILKELVKDYKRRYVDNDLFKKEK